MLEGQRMLPARRMLAPYLRNTYVERTRRGAYGQHEATRSWRDDSGVSCQPLLEGRQKNGR